MPPRTATVAAARALGPDTRLLELALPDGEALGFVGGQYIIVDSGVPLPGGKVAKRAYSLVSSDREQGRVELAVKRLPVGHASDWLHQVPVGGAVRFSGPWGSFRPAPDSTAAAGTLVFATDTGITAALGLVQGAAFSGASTVGWLLERQDYFLPPSLVEERLAAAGLALRIVQAGSERPERIAQAVALALALVGEHALSEAYLAGDGAVIHPVRDALLASGMADRLIRIEAFFNNPNRKAF